MLLLIYGISFVTTVNCYSYAAVTTAPPAIPKDFNPVEHMQTFLEHVQKKVKNCHVLLKNINSENYVLKGGNTAADPKNTNIEPAERSNMNRNIKGGIAAILSNLGMQVDLPNFSSPVMNAGPILNILTNALNVFLRMGAQREGHPGDILSGLIAANLTATSKEPFKHVELVSNSTAYASVAFERLCEQIALKRPEDVKEVVQHAMPIVDQLHLKDRLIWLDEPMTRVLNEMANAATEMPIDKFKRYAIMMHFMMVHRENTISLEVNTIIDFANKFINTKDGEHLFQIVQEFKDFPNVAANKTAKALCQDIIEAFEKPYGNVKDTIELKRFVNLANQAFKDRHPTLQIRYRKHGGIRSKRKNLRNKDHNVQNVYNTIFPSQRLLRLSNLNQRRRRRLMNADILETGVAKRQIISVKDYRHVSRERFTTRKKIKRYENYKYLPKKKNVIREISMENNNFYREVSKEELGIKKIIDNTNEIKDVNKETETRHTNNDYKQVFGVDVTKFPIITDAKEMKTAPRRFHMTHRENIEIENVYLNYGMMTRKLFDPNVKKTSSHLFTQSNEGRQKRFNIINPLPIDAHWIDTTKAYLQIRRTTQYKKPHIDRYKVFDRRTTEFKNFRRANVPIKYVDIEEYSKYIEPTDSSIAISQDISKGPPILNNVTIKNVPKYALNVINNEYLRKVASSSRHSENKTFIKVDLVDQLIYNNTSYKEITVDKTANSSAEADVKEILKRHLYRDSNN